MALPKSKTGSGLALGAFEITMGEHPATGDLGLLQLFLTSGFALGALLATLLHWGHIRFPGGLYWISGLYLLFGGTALDLVPEDPWGLVDASANGSQVSGAVMFFLAIVTYRSEGRAPTWFFAVFAVVLVAFLTTAQAPYLHQSLVFALLLGLMSLINGIALIWPGRRRRGGLPTLVALPFFILGLACFVRIGLLLPYLWNGETFDPTGLNVFYVGSAAALSMSYLFGYFALCHLHSVDSKVPGSPGGATPPASPSSVSEIRASLARYEISPREQEVALLVIEGLTSAAIGERLFISTGTVKNHLKSLYKKTSSANRADFVRRTLKGE